MKENIHILPVNDLLVHNEIGVNCFCNPKIMTGEYDKETGVEKIYGSKIIIHNAWDKRK